MSTLLFKFVFLSNASQAVVLTSTELAGAAAPTVNISSELLADGTTFAAVVTGGALAYNSITKNWVYRLANADLATYGYTGMATTTYATASPASVHALGIVIPDELISTRNATTPPTVEAIADGVLDEAAAGHTGHIAGIATAAEDNTAHGSGAWGASTGATAKVYTVTVAGAPKAGVYCRMTSDIAGTLNIDAGTTNALGQVTFHHDLPVGTTVYIWRTLAGYEASDPDVEVTT